MTCNQIFGNILLEENNLNYKEYNLCLEFSEKYCWNPSYIIYIQTDPNVCYMRFKERARKGENIEIDYFNKLHKLHENIYLNPKLKDKIYIINGNQNKENIQKDLDIILEKIRYEHTNNKMKYI